MNEEKIRKRYQREDESDARGTNVGAMNKFIEMLHLHEKNEDPRIKSFAENFEVIDNIAPNFTIFEGKNCFFMYKFKAYEIAEDTDMLVASHEFGHAVLSIMNDTAVPENYGNIIENAKKHALSLENKEYFKEYIQYISGKTDRKEERTQAEKGPVSDIISSIFQLQGLRIGSHDNVCILPSSHSRSYYYDEEKNAPKLKYIFDEDFANYYSLKVNNCTQEIETIRNLFGDELIQVLDTELDKAHEKLLGARENLAEESNKDPMEQIKNVVIFSRQDELKGINVLEKAEAKTREEGERDE